MALDAMNALLTDLYELTMAAGYHAAGKIEETATFELSVRRLPPNRNFVLAAGLPAAVDYLLNLSFEEAEIAYLRSLPQFQRAPEGFWEYLRSLRFHGDVFAVAEGTPLFPGEPMLTLRAPIAEAQLAETYLLAALSFPSLIASKAARIVEAAEGRPVVEFGTRRAHTPEAGVAGARAAYLAGCAGTSNTLAGFLHGIPPMGTAAHSWVMSFGCESESFRRLYDVLGDDTVQLIDTYDPLEGARRAAGIDVPQWGVRIDSGDPVKLAGEVRGILDGAGRHDMKIMASGDLNEWKIRDIVRARAPIDAFGVGTELATSADAPSLSAVYKLVELDISGIKRFAAKYSEGKSSMPGAKQIFRAHDRDVLARSGECGSGKALLRPVILGGAQVEPLPSLAVARAHAAESVAALPGRLRELEVDERGWPVQPSRELEALAARTRANLLG
jgi:nicotinate phosphoribosyltransferase